MVRVALLGIASAIFLPISLPAQSERTSTPSPLEVTIELSDEQMQIVDPDTHSSVSVPKRAVEIRNVSDKCVVGISLRTEDKDSEGNVVATGNVTIFRQHDGEFSWLLGPGADIRLHHFG